MKEERFKKADESQSQLSNFKYEYDVLGNVTKKWWKTDSALPRLRPLDGIRVRPGRDG